MLLAFAGVALTLTAGLPAAQSQSAADEAVATAANRPEVAAALMHLDSHRDSTEAFLADIAAIVSPSGQAQARADAVAARMHEIGLTAVAVDDTPNAVGLISGPLGARPRLRFDPQ